MPAAACMLLCTIIYINRKQDSYSRLLHKKSSIIKPRFKKQDDKTILLLRLLM